MSAQGIVVRGGGKITLNGATITATNSTSKGSAPDSKLSASNRANLAQEVQRSAGLPVSGDQLGHRLAEGLVIENGGEIEMDSKTTVITVQSDGSTVTQSFPSNTSVQRVNQTLHVPPVTQDFKAAAQGSTPSVSSGNCVPATSCASGKNIPRPATKPRTDPTGSKELKCKWGSIIVPLDFVPGSIRRLNQDDPEAQAEFEANGVINGVETEGECCAVNMGGSARFRIRHHNKLFVVDYRACYASGFVFSVDGVDYDLNRL